MDKEYLNAANSAVMWIACGIMVLVAMVQAMWFIRKSYKTALESDLEKPRLIKSIRAAAISSVGPSAAVMIAMISLVAALGSPLAWQRLSVIGNVTYELSAANVGAMAMGAELGGEGFNGTVLSVCAWLCALGAAGYLLIVAVLCPSFGKMRTKLSKGNTGALSLFSVSAMIGLFSHFTGPNLLSGSAPTIAAVVGGGGSMAVFSIISNKFKIKWLKEWMLGLAMLAGMFCAVLFL